MGAALPICLVGIWAVVTSAGWVDELFLPTPTQVVVSLVASFAAGGLARDIGATIARSLLGFLLAAALLGAFRGWRLPTSPARARAG